MVDKRPDVLLRLPAPQFDELIEMLALLVVLAEEYTNPENALIAKRLGKSLTQQGRVQEHQCG